MRLNAYGLAVDLEVDLPGVPADAAAGPPELRVVAARAQDVEDAWSGSLAEPARTVRTVDGAPFTAERGPAGDVRYAWAGEAAGHLDPAEALLRCVPRPGPRWARLLLDSLLGSAALSLGAEALHGAAVVVDGRAVVIVAVTGGGKSTLAAELVGRGHALLADDVVVLTGRGGEVVAHPAPPVLSLALDRPPGSVGATALGRQLAVLDGEAWMAVPAAARGPVPLGAVVLLERRAGARAQAVVDGGGPLSVLGHLLSSGPGPEREARRFHLAADVAEHHTVLRLGAPLDLGPGATAGLLEQALDASAAPPGR